MSEGKKVTGTPNSKQLEQALQKSLASGVSSLAQQVRYILAISQMTAAKPNTAAHPETPATIAEARLAALVDLAHALNDDQRKALFKDIQRVGDDDIRLQLIIDLVPRFAADEYKSIATKLWEQARALNDPVIRSQVLFELTPLLEQTNTIKEQETKTPLEMVIELAKTIKDAESNIRSLTVLAFQLPDAEKSRLLNNVLDKVSATNNSSLRANTIIAIADKFTKEMETRVLKSAGGITASIERARALIAIIPMISTEFRLEACESALETIVEIDGEDDRTNALIALAPNLEVAEEDGEYPVVLEQALAIAITLSKRHLRARALVALAPHLTLDLQGEALAAVHSLSSERDRAIMLGDLAPTLPSNMLVASLAVAHTMREQDARVHALTIMAHYAPKQARSQALLDALAAASNLPHHYERVTALVALFDVLPPQLRDQAFTNALETTRHIENENARARALGLLGHHLPPALINRALEAAYQVTDPQQRLNALIGIMPRVSDDLKVTAIKQMLESVRQITIGYKQARALISTAPHLTSELVNEALEIASSLDDAFDRVSAYISLAQNMPREARPKIVARAWKLMREIDEGYDRSSALAAIAPFLPSSAHSALAEQAGEVIRSIEDEYDRASAISILAPLLAYGKRVSTGQSINRFTALKEGLFTTLKISQQSLRMQQLGKGIELWSEMDDQMRYELWKEIVPRMTTLPLSDVLLCLGALTPIFATFGGEEKLREIAHILGVR